MQKLYYQFPETWFGDCMPFGHGDKFYLYHQRDTRKPGPFGEPFGWDLATTSDFVHYEDCGVAIPRGTDEEQDQFIFAGSVFEAEGQYHIFYTGYNRDYPALGKPSQVLMHAYSDDLVTWHKTQDALTFTPQEGYDPDDWRDPWVIRDEENDQYLLILGARLQGPKTRQTGRTVKFTSKDLKNWKFEGDFWAPDLYTMHEMPDLFKIGDWWYHIVTEYSDRSKMVYRMSKSLNGPWIAPKDDAFDGRAYYAGRTFELNGQRILFGWVATKDKDDDDENFIWAGTFMAHEVYQKEDGTLGVRIPETVWNAFDKEEKKDDFVIDTPTKSSEVVVGRNTGDIFKFEADVEFSEGTRTFGVRFYEDEDKAESYQFVFNTTENRYVFEKKPNWPWPANQNIGLERPLDLIPGKKYNIRMIVDDTIATIYVDGVALNARAYKRPGESLSLFASEGSLKVTNCKVTTGLIYQPILLSWENWQSQIYAGSKLAVVAHVVNDDDYGNDLDEVHLQWWIEKEGEKVLAGEVNLPSVPYYGTCKRPLSIDIPQNLPSGDYMLKGEIWSKGSKVSYNESELFIAGEDWRGTEVIKKTIYVYDSSAGEQTLSCLQKLGYLVKAVRMVKELPRNSTLILAKNSWDDSLNNQSEQLKEYVSKGGRIICLQQDAATFNQSWLPTSVEFLKDSNNDPVYLSPSLAYADGMNINLERPYHPVFNGLTPKQFRLWSDYTSYDESKKGFPAIYPVDKGYDLRESGMENVAVLANYSRALAATALSEMFMGKGSILLSGFDLINHCGVDPVADKLLFNMLRYMSVDKQHEPYVEVTDSIIWGDYASERGIVNAPCNGLMVNAVPIIPKGQEHDPRYEVKIDEYGYQYAGAYGGWNSKPGVQYVPYGRRPMAPFTFSKGGSPLISKSSTSGEGYFYMTLSGKKKTMITILENPVDEPLNISITINDKTTGNYVLQPKQQLSVETDISHIKNRMKVSLKGDRRVILLKTILSTRRPDHTE